MPVRSPVPQDPNALRRDLDPRARGLLRYDTPNYWGEDVHALSNLSRSQVLRPRTFDELAEVNKRVAIAHIKHVLDVLNKSYLRRVPPPGMDLWQLQNHPVLFVRTEEMWGKILELAKRPGAGGGTATDSAARDLADYLDAGLGNGDLVHGSDLEECFEHGQRYSEPLETACHKQPILNIDNLDSDDVHAFLCAYETCFHS
jgi:hypothetical protein